MRKQQKGLIESYFMFKNPTFNSKSNEMTQKKILGNENHPEKMPKGGIRLMRAEIEGRSLLYDLDPPHDASLEP